MIPETEYVPMTDEERTHVIGELAKVFTFKDTTATKKIFEMGGRIRAVAGGTSASKTISILVWCIDYCNQQKNAMKLVSVVSQTYGHLEKGAMLDFELIMRDRGYWDDSSWNKTKHTYTFPNSARLEFFAIDTELKGRGPRRDVLFVNEANSIKYSIFDQLRIRTRECIWLDWNPSEEFWFYEEILTKFNEQVDFLTLTYLDNEALDQQTVDDIEAHRHNRGWWRVYGEGKLGDVEGRIFTGWTEVDVIPHEARLVRRGLDFGYSHDPAALLDIYEYNGGYIFDERLYATHFDNPQIAKFVMNMEEPHTLVCADSSEPKSIQELQNHGMSVFPAAKGPGSVNFGIKHIQDQQISFTARSFNLRKEYKKYFWLTDKDGKITKTPMDEFNHLLDAARYGMETLGVAPKRKEQDRYVPPPSASLIY